MRLMMHPGSTQAFLRSLAFLAVLFLLVGCGKDSLVNPKLGPAADFSASPLTGDQPLDVTFTDHSSAGTSSITSWFWDFGDGVTSTLQNVGHLYGAPGVYDVSLRVTTDVGVDTKVRADYITVTKAGLYPPNAAFTATPTTGGPGTPVHFTDQSAPGSGLITARAWDFGDGGTSTAQNPTHTYTVTGTYTVSLSVTTSVGTDTESKPGYIVIAPTKPTAAFAATPTLGQTPLVVTFTDQSLNGGNPITSRIWSFGDGATDTIPNPVHTYTTPGSFTVTLTETNAAGTDTATKTNLIVASQGPVPPTAAFTGTPTSGFAPLNVQFTDQSIPGSAVITSWLWDFGDGATSTLQSPSHSYAVGRYDVKLTVTTADGADNENKVDYVVVTPAPVAPTVDFSGTPRDGFLPLPVTFSDLSTNGGAAITSWAWTFGDGGTSTAQNPSHTYTVEGVYNVTLTATNSAGSTSLTKNAYITANHVPVAPVAAFVGSPTSGNVPLTVNFTDQSIAGSAPITSRAWDFGDGGTSTAQNPSHTYNTPGSYFVSLSVTTADGANTASKSGYITVNVAPVAPTANFTSDRTSGFVPLAVQFTDGSTNGGSPITSWSWTFGDGGTSTAQNPSHTYTVPGTYNVKLKVANAVGPDSTTKSSYIQASIVPVGPTAAFTATPTSGDAPLTVHFTDTSTAGTSPITSWAWDFGDGGSSTLASPTHVYAVGTYDVKLTVTTADGTDNENKVDFVVVTPAPVAPTVDFSATPRDGFIPMGVTFSDLSTNGGAAITSWSWTFGDGGTSTVQNPTHNYTTEGAFNVTLTATNSAGPGTLTKTAYITTHHVPVAPVAAFVGSPTSGDAPLTVNFTDQSTAGSAPITSRAWDFGDGGTSTATNPSHTYTTPGTYFVSLSVTTADGADTDNKSNYIQVNVPPTVPTANFTSDRTSGFVPLAVSFTDGSTNGGSTITSWRWAFGDGGTSTSQNPTHTYTVPGTYNVKLRVANAVGPDSTTKSGYITANVVPVPPTAAYTATPTSGDAPLTVNFTDTSTPGTSPVTSWLWDFGDGGSSALQSPSHVYAVGTYDVKLTVTTADGTDNENKVDFISVTPAPVAPTVDFSATPRDGFIPMGVTFSDLSTNGGAPITSWSWTFGDGATSTAQNPSHTYTVPGTYDVKLKVANAVGPDSTTKSAYITANVVPVAPTASFTADVTSGDAPLTVNFTDTSTAGTSAIKSWLWEFGDGETSTEANPSHTYNDPGSYSVSLTVTTDDGQDTVSKSDYITASTPATAGP
jgi:PKD repeat protein